MSRWSVFVAILFFCSGTVLAQAAVEPATGSRVDMPATSLPYSRFASPEARTRFEQLQADQGPPSTDIADLRRFYQDYNDARLREVQSRYLARVEATTMGGVPVQVVDPAAGVAEGNGARVLINLHGGAFMWGAGSGALVEAIPIAVVAGMRVVAVDYRLAPEHPYPAAAEDVEAVYRALLEEYRAENIGIYGCSAGGVLTAQATARILRAGLPRPGAIGTFCGTGLPFAGDSVVLGQLATGAAPMKADSDARPPYLLADSVDGPAAYPGKFPELLERFPPTLLLAGGRDFSVSALTTMHRRLLGSGVEADLVLFDGMWHAFFVFPELPESREAYGLIADFFDRHLGRAPH
ncbi:alpha/beta hydrolase [Pseudoxanthomonas kalamensis]|uniref:alpha/beta hydrolase n=1 Tax=Pseudoxanthomonas kalamensis TaxID=289483 RepID=UPI001B8803D6|nr:alpha/beta hydrolase fold domain-containing protein [Pseudoxanthomonas kalamensis]